MRFHLPDPDTGYCEDDVTEPEDIILEEDEEEAVPGDEVHSALWDGERELLATEPHEDDGGAIPLAAEDAIDPETGCTPAEMKEQEINWIVDRLNSVRSEMEGRAA